MFIRAGVASFVIAIAAQIAWVCPTRADDTEASDVARAEEYAASAYEAYARGEFARAIGLYGNAYDASASADILYNIARIYDTKLRNRPLAIEYYQRYARDAGADAERLQVATDRLLALREQEHLAQRAAEEPVVAPVKPSRELSREAQSSHESRDARDSRDVQDERQESRERARPRDEAQPYATAPRGNADSHPFSDRGLSTYELAGFITGSAGIVGIAMGVGFGLAAKSDADVVHDLCSGNACSSQRGVDLAERGSNLASVSTVSFVAGAVLVAGGAALLFLGPRAERAPHDNKRAQLAPWADRHGFGMQLASSF